MAAKKTKNDEEQIETVIIPKDIDDSQYITVRNGFQGSLVYKSKKTGEVLVWEEFGDEQEIQLRDLKYAKNSDKGFFVNNWFMFNEEDAWVPMYLGVERYYKHALTIDSFDELFKMKAKDIEKKVSGMSDGLKKSIAYRAHELIASKNIDSLSVIETLEKALGVNLIEK